uniref:Prefoldin subunit 4 n=1 Tax=Heterorhabditis bacteriophora TaxID=37862 RepID=A0A1I7WSM0_HETBA
MSCPNVTAADQQQINRFARLHQNYTQMKDEIKELENELQNINEAADELLLLDSEDAASVPLRIGQTFIHFDSVSTCSYYEVICDKCAFYCSKLNKLK